MFYTYVLLSKNDGKFYTGYTQNLKVRFEQHNKGQVESTRERIPLELVYYEACLNQEDATHREKYLKTYHGKAFIRKRIKSYLTGLTHNPTPITYNLLQIPDHRTYIIQ